MVRLRAENIAFRYPHTDQWIVRDWSQEFTGGTVSALMGASGCGKSTRMFLLALLTRPTHGAVFLDDRRIDCASDGERSAIRAHRYGFIFQDAVLDPTRTVLDNVVESCLYRGQNARSFDAYAYELLERMEVSVPAYRKPGQISGGQAQRIAVCRALVGAPDVIFADEPTGNLDQQSGQAVISMLREQADLGACVVIVTHDQDVARHADTTVTIPPLRPGGNHGQ